MFSNGTNQAFVYRLPQSWVIANSWEKCMRNWMEQQNDAASEAGLESMSARYRDFKVFIDANHAAAGFANNALPLGWGVGGVGVPGGLPTDVQYDWEVSEIVIPNDTTVGNTTERTFHMIGDDTIVPTPDSVSMVKAYAESRSRPHGTDPNTVAPSTNLGGILGEMFDVGDDDSDVIANYRTENSQTPYPVGDFTTTEFYPGGTNFALAQCGLETVMTNRSTAATGGTLSTTYSPGFLAGCGLLCIQMSHGAVPPTSIRFKVGLAPGDYKGVAARSMAVVN